MADETPNATVIHREDPTDRLVVVRIAPDHGPLPGFVPGQFTTLGLPHPEEDGKLLRRVYSIASAPNPDHLEFFVERIKEGKFTTQLWPLNVGDALWLSPRLSGRFTLDAVPEGKDLALFGTGTGLAPYMSMLRHFRGTGRWNRCVIVHGARTAEELVYRSELEAAAADDESITYIPTITREPEDSGWAGSRGRMQTLLDGDTWAGLVGGPLSPDTWHAYLCGNPAMIDDMEARLTERGFHAHTKDTPGNIHFERYW
jgi:ferredoxin--NADP+ reductase